MVALVLGAGACSRIQDDQGRTPAAGVSVSYLLERAKEKGASAEQIAILEKGVTPSFEDYEAATRRALACMDDAGIDVMGPDVEQRNGIPVLTYSAAGDSPGRTFEQTRDAIKACEVENSLYVASAWELQPVAVEAEQDRYEAARPALYACAARIGLKPDPDLATRDLMVQIGDYMIGLSDQGVDHEDCFAALQGQQ